MTPAFNVLLEVVDDVVDREHQAIPRGSLRGTPSSEGESSDRESDQSSVHLAATGTSGNSH